MSNQSGQPGFQDDAARMLSVVIPAFNEEKTVATVVQRVLKIALGVDVEVIVIDDGSTDRTGAIIDSLARDNSKVRVVHQPNQGKTAALRQGFAMSRGDVVIVQDADFEYDPSEIRHVVRPIFDGHADVVFGSRFLVRKEARVLYFHHYVANRFLTLLSNVLTNLNMTDVETGYKAFRGDVIRNMTIQSTGFGVEIEVAAKVAKLDAVVYEVPISYHGRTYAEGKKIGFKDGVLALWYIIRFNLFCNLAQSFRQIPATVARRHEDFGKPSVTPF